MDKKKVGILTFFNVQNFGAELQAFALQKAINEIGVDCELINYPYFKNPHHVHTIKSKPTHHIKIKTRLIETLFKNYRNLRSFRKKNNNSLFQEFHKSFSKISKKNFFRADNLYSAEHKYSHIVVGSDQVWNPNNFTNLEVYFLNFLKNHKIRKVSYAASIGVSKIDPKNYTFYKINIENIDAISVREDTARDVLKQFTDKPIETVLDPTLLLHQNQYENLVSKNLQNLPKNYILLYNIRDTKEVNKFALHHAGKHGLEIIKITKNGGVSFLRKNLKAQKKLIGPEDFIYLFEHAAQVITNSFHGLCFSIIYRKKFISILDEKKDNNSRLLDLLERLKLQNRITYDSKISTQTSEILSTNPFSDEIINILDNEIEKSKIFLKTHLNG